MTTRDTTPAPTKPKSRRAGGSPRFDHEAARLRWIGLGPTRTFVEIARVFDVSDTAVRAIAARHGWKADAERFDEEMRRRAELAIVKSREQQVAQTARIRDHAAERLERRLAAQTDNGDYAELDDTLVLRAYEIAEKNLRLDLGEATDRVSLVEVQGILQAILRAASRHVGKEQRDAFLADVSEATSGLLALEQRSAA